MITIQAAAIKLKDGVVRVGPNHAAIYEGIRYGEEEPRPDATDATEGFITSEGKFVDRREAAIIAFNSGQIKEPVGSLCSYMI